MDGVKAGKGDGAIGLHVVDENPIAAQGLRSILKAFPRVTFHGALPKSLAFKSSLVLVVNAGTLAAPIAEFLRMVRHNYPKASVVVLNASCSGESLVELLFLGAAGFVAYDRAKDELCDAIRSVAQGRMWITRGAIEEFDRRKRLAANGKRNGRLTGRETTILGLLERGFCNKEIASMTGISISTVKFHLRNIFIKTGVSDRLRAIEWARQTTGTQSSESADSVHPCENAKLKDPVQSSRIDAKTVII